MVLLLLYGFLVKFTLVFLFQLNGSNLSFNIIILDYSMLNYYYCFFPGIFKFFILAKKYLGY